MGNSIYSANTVFNNLKEYEDKFNDEYKVISELKCMLVNELEISDYMIDGIYVSVSGNEYEYYLDFNNISMCVTVKDKMIVDYDYE